MQTICHSYWITLGNAKYTERKQSEGDRVESHGIRSIREKERKIEGERENGIIRWNLISANFSVPIIFNRNDELPT